MITPLTAAFDGFKTKFKGIWDSIGGIVRGTVNIIIDLINRLIRGVNKFKIQHPGLGQQDTLLVRLRQARASDSAYRGYHGWPRARSFPPNRQFAGNSGRPEARGQYRNTSGHHAAGFQSRSKRGRTSRQPKHQHHIQRRAGGWARPGTHHNRGAERSQPSSRKNAANRVKEESPWQQI